MTWRRSGEHAAVKPGRESVTPIGRVRDGEVAMLIVFVRAARARDCALALERAGFTDVAGPFVPSDVPGQWPSFTQPPAMRAQSRVREQHAFGDVVVDVAAREVFRSGARVQLTPSELDVLVALARAAGEVVPASELQRVACGAPRERGDTHVLRMHIVHLRQKLEQNAKQPRHLLTVWGRGYRLAGVRMLADTPRLLTPRP